MKVSAVGCDNTTPISASPVLQPDLGLSHFMPLKQEAAQATRTYLYMYLEYTVLTVSAEVLPGLRAEHVLSLLQLLLHFYCRHSPLLTTFYPKEQMLNKIGWELLYGPFQLLPVRAALVSVHEKQSVW